MVNPSEVAESGSFEENNIVTSFINCEIIIAVHTYVEGRGRAKKWLSRVMKYNLKKDSGKPLAFEEIGLAKGCDEEKVLEVHRSLVSKYIRA